MRVNIKRSAIGFIAFIVIATSAASSLIMAQGAQEAGNGFRISPVRSEFTIEKGASETIALTVENPTGGPITATAVVNNFIASESEDGEPRLILDENAPQPSNNFKDLVAAIPDLPLKPRQKKDIDVTISVPATAEPGGYYGAIRFLPVDNQGDGNVGLTASVGSIVLVRVPGDLTEKVDLVELSAAQDGETSSFFTGGDINIVTRLENTGNIHLAPFGKIQVKNIFGNVEREFEINSTDPRANILPGSIRRFEDDLKTPDRGWFGRYTITSNIGYSQGSGELISSSSSFWYLPTWFLIAVLVLIIVIVGAVYWRRRSKRW